MQTGGRSASPRPGDFQDRIWKTLNRAEGGAPTGMDVRLTASVVRHIGAKQGHQKTRLICADGWRSRNPREAGVEVSHVEVKATTGLQMAQQVALTVRRTAQTVPIWLPPGNAKGLGNCMATAARPRARFIWCMHDSRFAYLVSRGVTNRAHEAQITAGRHHLSHLDPSVSVPVEARIPQRPHFKRRPVG